MLADGHTSSSKNVVSSAFFFDNVIPFASWTSLAVTQESISFLEISIFFLSSTKPFMVLIYVDPRAVSTSCLLKFQVANLLLEQYTQTCFPTTSPTWRRNNFAFFPTVSLENKRKKKTSKSNWISQIPNNSMKTSHHRRKNVSHKLPQLESPIRCCRTKSVQEKVWNQFSFHLLRRAACHHLSRYVYGFGSEIDSSVRIRSKNS